MPQRQDTDIVLITGHGDMKTAIAAFRAGAYDYLLKPVQVEELVVVINRIAEHQSLLQKTHELTNRVDKLTETNIETESRLKSFQNAYAEVMGIGRVGVFSGAMRAVMAMAERFHEDRSVPVLIEGEIGTGKEIIARFVHYGHSNVTTPFVSLNCTAISPNLFESELFCYNN